jgi:dTMP kinase
LSERRGRLIVFEGTEGAGKSTHVARAAAVLERDGHRVQVTAEPGGTSLGCELRELLLHRLAMPPSPLAELFLYLADRAQHVREVIRPALEAGQIVLCDRFSGSTIAYQGHGRGLDLEVIARGDAAARDGVAPDLVLLLDCPVRTGLERVRGHDRFHAETTAFHERVRRGFLTLAAEDASGWRVIDATQPEETVHAAVLAAIHAVLAP